MRERLRALYHCLRGGRRVLGWRYAFRYAWDVQRGWPNIPYVKTGHPPREAIELGRKLAEKYKW